MKLIILTGPTGSGKSSLGIRLLEESFDTQIINADSKQIYKEIPIITAQPTTSEIKKYDHLLYGHKSITQNYDIKNWLFECENAIKLAISNQKIPMIIGGTGFYINSLINGIDALPEIDSDLSAKIKKDLEDLSLREKIYKTLIAYDQRMAEKIHFNDSYRIHRAACIFFQTNKSIFEFYSMSGKDSQYIKKIFPEIDYQIFTLLPEREILYEKINKRFDSMIFEKGAIEEIENLKNTNFNENSTFYKTLGVPEILDYLNQKISKKEMMETSKQNTRNYAKRQITWIKNKIHNNICYQNDFDILLKIKEFIEKK